MNILFLGGGKRWSLLERFSKAASEEQISFNPFVYELVKEVHVAPIANVITGESFDSEKFIPHLKETIKEFDINVVIPCMDTATVALGHTDIPQALVSSANTCHTMHDKTESKMWFYKNGIRTPKSYGFPCIIKHRFGYGSRDQCIVHSESDYTTIDAKLQGTFPKDYITEKFIKGQEYTIDCYVAKSGEILGISPRARLVISRGEVENSVTVDSPELVEYSRRILNSDKFWGPVTIQIIEEEMTKDLYAIEVNPRFGGGVICSIEAGADYPRLVLREFLGRPVKPVKARPNLLMIRSARETFFNNYKLD